MKIIYPTWKMRGSPTPHEKLMVCPSCGQASWEMHTSPPTVKVCHSHSCHKTRLREATPEEYEEGRKSLEEIIG